MRFEPVFWGSEPARSEIVLIGARNGFDSEKLEELFESCAGSRDEAVSPFLQMMRKIAESRSYALG